MAGQALDGILALDLTDRVAGAYCTKLLADAGATVVKVEPPSGDPVRSIGPFLGDVPHPECSATFLFLNTNKQSITLDLSTTSGQDLFGRLLKRSHILVESLSPGRLGHLGFGSHELRAVRPELVITSITPFGQKGHYRDYIAHDLTLQALSGILYANGEPHREPVRLPGPQAEFLGGAHAALATIAAVLSAELCGRGQHIDCSIMEAAGSILAARYLAYFYKHETSLRRGNGRATWGIYPCEDGYISLNVYSNTDEWDRFKAWVQIPELDDPRFDTAQGRRENVDELEVLLLQWYLQHTKDELYLNGQRHRVAVGLGATMHDLQQSVQLRAREYFVTLDHPYTGSLVYPGSPFKMSGTPHRVGRAPTL
ncbi:MAG: CoA transferase, partial [Bacteroidota bacterium]